MSVKITDNTPTIISQTQQRASIFLRLLCDNVTDLSRPNTPKMFGNLGRDVIKSVQRLKGKIEWPKVYASYQERGKRADGTRVVKKYTTAGTGPHFAENAVKKSIQNTGAIAKLAHLI